MGKAVPLMNLTSLGKWTKTHDCCTVWEQQDSQVALLAPTTTGNSRVLRGKPSVDTFDMSAGFCLKHVCKRQTPQFPVPKMATKNLSRHLLCQTALAQATWSFQLRCRFLLIRFLGDGVISLAPFGWLIPPEIWLRCCWYRSNVEIF